MRMTRFDHNCTAYTLTEDSFGYLGTPTVLYTSFDVDVQSSFKSAGRLVEFGIDTTSPDSKTLYYDKDYHLVKDCLVKDNDTGFVYQIVAQLPWEGHYEAIAKPWTGVLV